MYNFSSILTSWKDSDFDDKLARLRREHSMTEYLLHNQDIAGRVRDVVMDVGRRGDKAVCEYTERFDNIRFEPSELRVSEEAMHVSHEHLPESLLHSMRRSIENVRDYQSRIFVGSCSQEGTVKYTPLKRAGLCIPGASAPLPSTVIMTAVPAIAAGVEQIAVISPPRFEGSIHPVILGLCWELGISEVYRIGGAQAVAALAWGTETIPKVDKIAGPGNDYVQLAKKEVFGLVDMDSFAGPSDVLIMADENANPSWIAADMLSQAEHNPGAGIVVTYSESLAREVVSEVEAQCSRLSRSSETAECLEKYSAVVVVEDEKAVIDFANNFAAEHLEVQFGRRSREIAEKIQNAGAIFVGPYSPVAAGDYFAGPSHTLPTRQSSKYFSPLSSNDFVKSSSIIDFSEKMLSEGADDIIRLAEIEGLDAHAKSVKIRLGKAD
ncbi:Histidinol dehydrogenase [Sedimentisphaera cyanobacteriorum]|uniref:Histidinol dehydrogenase n=1 Tax=Sedimentisphaera cyanobacteriorum TaxID=1940790 RepID=A0A1Q2HRA9_9BACT|nr:histidinol dehydrogenase [Sedimentisphaera cyanobacteriorum]AQQ09987.1 Histidinol dehydrogenase [Sedimentisphaera cyanobacteriorum]